MDRDEILKKLNEAKQSNEKLSVLGELVAGLQDSFTGIDGEISNKIIEFLDDENDFVRIKSTEAAEFCKDEAVIIKLCDKVKHDTNYFVRGFAAKALGSIGNMVAKESLERATEDPEGFVVSFAVQSLKTINMKVSFSSKLELLKTKMKESSKK